jgi:hypothetical protein
MRKFVLGGGSCAVLAAVAALAALAFPPDGSADGSYAYVALSASGPMPSTIGVRALSHGVIFVNQDSVAHTVVFADGRCSLTVPPGEPPVNESSCTSRRHGVWPIYVGSYVYAVDGTFPGTIRVVPWYRSVSLTARTHTIRLGSQLTLHGQLTYRDPNGGPALCGDGLRHPLRVLARHDRSRHFKRIAMFPVPGREANSGTTRCTFSWQLKVRPGERTTYIANAKGRADYWMQATSKPFTVRVRH